MEIIKNSRQLQETPEEELNMSENEKIAKWIGLEYGKFKLVYGGPVPKTGWYRGDTFVTAELPDYQHDLNALVRDVVPRLKDEFNSEIIVRFWDNTLPIPHILVRVDSEYHQHIFIFGVGKSWAEALADVVLNLIKRSEK